MTLLSFVLWYNQFFRFKCYIYPCIDFLTGTALQWRHNGLDGVSNHQPHRCYWAVYSGADQRKHQSSTSLAFLRGIHRGPVNSPHKWPVTRKMFPFDGVIMVIIVRLPQWLWKNLADTDILIATHLIFLPLTGYNLPIYGAIFNQSIFLEYE